jgi:hypothetical protein
MKLIPILLPIILLTSACSSSKKTNAQPTPLSISVVDERPIAFPTAEGFGKYATGGRGGKVYVVTNLNDKGPGSFREAAEKNIPRVIVFAISGTIHLESKINIKSNATIAGQTAPGDGVCFADHSVIIGGDNIIVRYIRCRMGDKYQRGGMVDGNGADDAFGASRRKNIIIDHCSFSWSTDEVCSIYNGDSTTIQWNMISEPLNYSYHFETGDKDYENHGYGGIWGGTHLTGHHNLFAHCNSRNPRFNGIRQGGEENVDYRNNVIYNWGSNNVYAGEGGNYNLVNNYYKYGPNTNKNVKSRIVNPWGKEPTIPIGKYYINGNYVDGNVDVTVNNWKGGVDIEKTQNPDYRKIKLENPFKSVEIITEYASDAYNAVLLKAGCSLPNRDTLDARIIENVKNRTGGFIDVQGGFPHGTDYEKTINAWPTLKTSTALIDTDADGMPDEWEIKNKLNPNDSKDASNFTLNKNYCNIEMYVNRFEY